MFLAVCLCSNAKLFSQIVEFKNYTTKDGLVSDELYNLYQDSKGYIWIFSNHGTCKYNGSEFVPVLKNLNIKESFIFSIAENTKGQKWVANSKAKIYEVRNDSAILIKGFERVSDSLKNSVSEIVTLAVDDSLNLYAGTKGKSYKLRRVGENYAPYCLSSKIRRDSILLRVKDVNHTLITIADHFENDEFVFKNGEKRLKKFIHIQLFDDTRIIKQQYVTYSTPRDFKKFGNDVYFNFYKVLVRITPDNILHYIDIGSVILCYTRDQSNHLWVGCLNDGLYELDEQGRVLNHYFENVTVNSVLADRQNGLWVSTSGQGLFHCLSLVNKVFPSGTPLGTELSFIKKLDDNVFVANKSGSLYCFNRNGCIVLRNADKDQPLGIVKHNRNYVLTNTFSVDEFNLDGEPKSVQIIGVTEKQYNAFSKSTDTLIFVWRRGLNFYVKGEQCKKVDFGCKIVSSELIGNKLWIGTENGVYSWPAGFKVRGATQDGILIPDKETLVSEPELNGLKNSIVSKVVAHQSGDIWFSSIGDGLFRFSKGGVTHFTSDSGLPTDIINGISFGSNAVVLLCTNKGLFYTEYNPDRNAVFNWKLLYPGNVASAEMLNDEIFLSSASGLVKINFAELKGVSRRLNFNLASVKIDQSDISISDFKEIGSNRSNLEFKFDLIGSVLDIPEIRYQLIGTVTDSGTVKGTMLKFSRLVPGSYVLSVMPVSANDKKSTLVIPFEVIPSFTQTTFFKILMVVLSIVAVVFVAKLVIRSNQRKQSAKAKNEQLILEYKLIALQAQINPHFISNCLAAIQHLIKNDKTDKAATYVAKFGFMVRQILEFSSQQLVTLKEELDLLGVYLELEQLRFENRFKIIVDVSSELDSGSVYLPPLILNPIVENAIWHGLLPLQNSVPGELEIQIKKDKDRLKLSVRDNGVGRSIKKSSGELIKTRKYGIEITEQRLSSVNYMSNKHEAAIVYTDLEDVSGKSEGTLVEIYLPLTLLPEDDE